MCDETVKTFQHIRVYTLRHRNNYLSILRLAIGLHGCSVMLKSPYCSFIDAKDKKKKGFISRRMKSISYNISALDPI